jgi:hypothetical protein
MQQRKQFIDEYMKQKSLGEAVPEVRHQRKTGYKWGGAVFGWLRARAPVTSAAQQPDGGDALARRCHRDGATGAPSWGAEETAGGAFASQSGVGMAECEHGRAHLQAQRLGDATSPPSPDSANLDALRSRHGTQCRLVHGLQRWSRCYPLTVMDAYSRFLIACIALPNTQAAGARRALRDDFEQFGLPHVIRTDNGRNSRRGGSSWASRTNVWSQANRSRAVVTSKCA